MTLSRRARPPRRRRVPPAVVTRVMQALAREIDGMDIPAIEKISGEHADDPFRVLIGTLLSARTQDQTTHAASTRLFKAAPTPAALARLSVGRIERLIYPVGFYRNKARFVKATAEAVETRFGGQVPATLEEMVTLPGVGRKTANLVMIIAFRSADHICVDTHVHRITNRLGWVVTSDPEATERALYATVEKRWWAVVNRYFVTWGQNVCRPVYPRCGDCALFADCPQIGVERVGKPRMPL
jgi:endonuclease III